MSNHFKLSKPNTQPNKASRPGYNQTEDYSNYPGDYSMSGTFGFKRTGKYDLAKEYDKYFQLKNEPSTSGTNMKSQKTESTPQLESRAVGAVAKAAASKGSSASSNTKTSMAERSSGVLGKLIGAGTNVANNRMNLRNQANVSENFFNNQLGRGEHVSSPHFHAGHHSDMAFNAQTQTIREQQNIQQSWSNMLGPVGGVFGHLRSRNHVSDLERNLNFKTATDTRGNAINPSESRNNEGPKSTARTVQHTEKDTKQTQQVQKGKSEPGQDFELQSLTKPSKAENNTTAETSFNDTTTETTNLAPETSQPF